MADDAEVAFRSGQQAASRGAWSEALAAYRRAVAADGKHWKARFGCGLARQRLADDQEAIADFDAVLSIRPELAQAWYSRAISRKRLHLAQVN
jgi:tetratricopeptide (TPR) repeat protein